ncbi:MAG: hypothetical protein KIS66_06825 [Fimbriimonadaceae bacterium]|nr:hypothetical protein [Fimbriimonadaceae bacterium]
MRSPTTEAPRTTERFRPVRARAVLVGLLMCVPAAYITASQMVSAIFSLMTASISIQLFLVIVNQPLRRFAPKLALSQTDLIVIFGMVAVACAASGEWMHVTQGPIHGLALFSDNNATIKDYLIKYMPDWLVVTDRKQVVDILGGGHDFWYVVGKLPLYMPRYLAWGALWACLCGALLFINCLMRDAWCRRERLAFPLIQLPVAMSENGGAGAMFRSREMWIAFAIMFGIDMLNGFNYLYPNLPAIPVKQYVDVQTFFTEPPLSQMGTMPIALYPFMAAVGLFMPSDLLLSLVVFYLMRKVLHVAVASQGIPQGMFSGTAISPGPPYFDEQTWGGVFAMFVGAVWVSRHYLKEVWGAIRNGRREEDGGVSHRFAFGGLILCTAGLVWFGTLGDLSIAYMIPYVLVFLIFSVVLTRIRAQLGPPTHEFAFFGPNSVMTRFLGTNWITDKQSVFMGQAMIWLNRIHRNHMMPYQLEAMKMGQGEKVSQRPIFWLIVAATILGFMFGMFFRHGLIYRIGDAYYWGDGEVYVRNIINNRTGPDVTGITMTIVGFIVVVAMDTIRYRFPAFPLHPAGYVLSLNYGVDYYWFGLLVALMVKNFVQRYYGLRGYDRLRNVALGILLGEYAAETIWVMMSLITHQSTYTISFNDRSLGMQ